MFHIVEGIRRIFRLEREIEQSARNIRETAVNTHKMVLENKDALRNLAKRIQCGVPPKQSTSTRQPVRHKRKPRATPKKPTPTKRSTQ